MFKVGLDMKADKSEELLFQAVISDKWVSFKHTIMAIDSGSIITEDSSIK